MQFQVGIVWNVQHMKIQFIVSIVTKLPKICIKITKHYFSIHPEACVIVVTQILSRRFVPIIQVLLKQKKKFKILSLNHSAKMKSKI